MKARELMEPDPEVLTPYDSVAKAARLMRGRGVAVLAVVQDRQELSVLGAVSDRQLLLGCTASGHDPRRCPVWNHVREDVARVDPEREVQPPARPPGRPSLERQPMLVVDADGRLVGLIDFAARYRPWGAKGTRRSTAHHLPPTGG